MTFLPIVERELRVGARRRFTYWSRLGAALFALAILVAMYALAAAFNGAIFRAGQAQFEVLKWLSFIFACSAGVFLTADTLSEEKREGTLGLLFLTDLRGHDVVLGKLISTSIVAFYGFLAAFPTLALTMLFGGVAAGEFWRMVLIICNTLFVSIAAGLMVSSISRDAVKAVNGALLVIAVLLGGLPLADLILAGGDATKFQPILSLASPAYLFRNAGPFMQRDFWLCVVIQNCLGWGMLALCSLCVPRTWQQKIAKRGVLRWNWTSGYRNAGRRRLLEKNPVLWLAGQDRWLRWLVWVLALLAAAQFCWSMIEMKHLNHNTFGVGTTPISGSVTSTNLNTSTVVTNSNGSVTYMYTTSKTTVRFGASRAVVATLNWLLTFGLKVWVALQACRFLVEAIRSGTLELILVSPLGPQEVIKGHARALLRIFLIPALLLLAIQLTTGVEGILEMRRSMPRMPSGTAGSSDFVLMQALILGGGLINFVTVLLALGWFGMWMGLTTRKVTTALLKTVVFVVVLPTLVIGFASGLLFALMMAAAALGGFHIWIWPFIYCGLNTTKDLVFIFWSRKQLYTRFREAAAMEARVSMTSFAPPAVAIPPPLASGA